MGRGYSTEEIRQKLITSLRDSDTGMSGVEISGRVGISRLTMTKYLKVFAAEGLLRQKNIGNVTLWFLEPGQESFSFPDDYFKVAELYLGHLTKCAKDSAYSVIRNCIHSGASASRLVLEVVVPASAAVQEMYDAGKIGSAEQGLMGVILSESLQILVQLPVVSDAEKNVIVLAADSQSVILSEAASAAYHGEGWRVWHLGDMSHAVDVLFDIDFQKLVGRVWRQKPGLLAVVVFSGTYEGLNFFADAVNPARKKSGRIKLILCGKMPKNAGIECDMASGRLEEVLQWSKTVSESQD
ncbi:MAG: ArsR family transcriptional regulator [Nitrosopumilus sp. H13]|nr:MAG: ArsR family transcriptional regulator [Nitrosopumilus sp. H13]